MKKSKGERRRNAEARKLKGKSAGKSATTSKAGAPAQDFEAQQVQELAEMDDWSSAWEQVKESGERWGGRGKGGDSSCTVFFL
jgi:hypothetical protein